MSHFPAVGEAVLVALPHEPLSAQRAAVNEVSEKELQLLLEPQAQVPPLMQLTGASVVLSFGMPAGTDRLSAHVLRLSGRKLTVRWIQDAALPERRRYFRLPLMQEVTVRVLQAWDPSLLGQSDEATGDDLSGNGIRVTTVLPLRMGDTVSVSITSPSGGSQTPLYFEGLVKRQLPAPDLRHTVGIQFNALSRIQEERLVAYLLQRQTELANH